MKGQGQKIGGWYWSWGSEDDAGWARPQHGHGTGGCGCVFTYLSQSWLNADTTGNWDVAECLIFCRVQFIGASAKIMFAERHTRQSIALGKEYFAERQALSKLQHSVKLVFAECNSTRQRHHSANIANTVTASPSHLILPSATN
jgi:hypothetical protein